MGRDLSYIHIVNAAINHGVNHLDNWLVKRGDYKCITVNHGFKKLSSDRYVDLILFEWLGG